MNGPWDDYAQPADGPPADGPWTAYQQQPAPAPAAGPWTDYQKLDVPEHIPEAMEQRIAAGDQARKREGGLLQTIPDGIRLMSTPEGRTRIWDAVKAYPSKMLNDMIEMGELPGKVAQGKVDLTTQEGIDQAVGLGMLVGLGRLNKLGTTGKTSGLSVAMGENLARIERSPTGEIHDLPIGGAARAEDFANAAHVVGGEEAPFAVQEKMLRSYKEEGIHPAELAHDAQTDPVVAQRLLSSDANELPGGKLGGSTEIPTAEILRRQRAKGETDYAFSQDAFLEPNAYHGFKNMAEVLPDSVNDQFQVHGLLSGDVDANLLSLLRNGIDQERGFNSGPPRGGSSGVDSTRTFGAPYLIISDRGKSIPETGIKNVVLNGPAEGMIEQFRSAFPDVNFLTVADADRFMRNGDLPAGGAGGKPPQPPTRITVRPEPPEGSFEAAQQKILEKISVGESAPAEGMTLSKLYRMAVDDLHPIKGVDADTYQLARLTRGQFGRAEHFLEHGTFDFNTLKTNGKPLSEIMEPMKGDLDGFRAYLASKRALEIEATERRSGLDTAAAEQVVAAGEGKYAKAAGDLVDYQANVLKYLKDSGVLSDKAFDAMREAGQNYIPFYRVIGDERGGPGGGSSFGPGNPVKRLKGSERDIVDPLESIIKNTYAFINVADRNAAGIKIIDALKEAGQAVVEKPVRDPELSAYLKESGVKDPDALADFIKAAMPDSGDTLSAYRDGKRVSVKVDDPELVAAFRGLDRGSADLVTRVLAVPARTLRAGAVLTPDFIARNLIRDFLTAFINTGRGVFTPIDTAKGLVGVIRKDADFLDWMKGGGANATFVALDRRYMQESLSKLTAETGLMDRAFNVVKSPLAGLRMVSELAENATRLAEFKRLTGATKEEIQKAAYASREVTLDFARIGAQTQSYNMITAFFNASLQGLDRTARAFIDRPVNTLAKVAGGVTLPSILLWWANHNDPRYRELPQWQRDMFWMVMTKDHIYRIPKPFEIGVIFGSSVERILDATVGNNPDAFDKLGNSIMQAFLPSYLPTAVIPIAEQWANRSSFTDRTLIPADQEKNLPEYQYTPYTTELSKALGKMISAIPGVRNQAIGPGAPFGPIARTLTTPILLENYVRSWTGGMGVYAMQIADAALRKTGVLPDPIQPAATLADIPFVKAFVARYPSASAESIQSFYDKAEVADRFYKTWQAKAQEGDAEAMQRIQDAGGPVVFLRLDAIKSTLTEHSKLVRDIYKNQSIPPGEKRQLIDGLYYNMIEIARAGNEMAKLGERPIQ